MSEDLFKPLRITLVGAPTSGKSEVAAKFAKRWGDIAILDNPAEDIEALGYELGMDGTPLTSMFLMVKQLEAEHQATESYGFLTVGSAIQRMAHIGAAIESLGDQVNRIPNPDNQRRLMYHNMIGHAIALSLTDEFDYHFVFYLPLPESLDLIVANGDIDESRLYNRRVDVGIQQLLEAFFIPALKLDGEDAANQMADHILDVKKKYLAQQEEQTAKA